MSLRDLHIALGWTLTVANGLVGLWALAAHRSERLRGKALWIATGVAEVLILVQVVIGVIQVNQGIEISGLHQAYGFVALFSVAIIYSYRQQIARWTYLLYGFGGLFIMGLGIRAILLG